LRRRTLDLCDHTFRHHFSHEFLTHSIIAEVHRKQHRHIELASEVNGPRQVRPLFARKPGDERQVDVIADRLQIGVIIDVVGHVVSVVIHDPITVTDQVCHLGNVVVVGIDRVDLYAMHLGSGPRPPHGVTVGVCSDETLTVRLRLFVPADKVCETLDLTLPLEDNGVVVIAVGVCHEDEHV
jgi:hypothetical protein